MCEIFEKIRRYLFFTIITFAMVISDDCLPGTTKKLMYENVYPVKGTWFKDIPSGKYYFRSGNSVFLQRSDLYYAKWVLNANFDYVLDSAPKWTWDKQGMLYSVVDNCSYIVEDYKSLSIPILCISTTCPNQIRFPSGGIWHYTRCKLLYDLNDTRFELSPDGFYKKWNISSNTQILPDRWTWDRVTGEWQPAKNKLNTLYTLNKAQTNNLFWNRNNNLDESNNPHMVLPQHIQRKK